MPLNWSPCIPSRHCPWKPRCSPAIDARRRALTSIRDDAVAAARLLRQLAPVDRELGSAANASGARAGSSLRTGSRSRWCTGCRCWRRPRCWGTGATTRCASAWVPAHSVAPGLGFATDAASTPAVKGGLTERSSGRAGSDVACAEDSPRRGHQLSLPRALDTDHSAVITPWTRRARCSAALHPVRAIHSASLSRALAKCSCPDCLVPGLMEALNPREDESHGSTEELPRGASGAGGRWPSTRGVSL